MVDARWEHVAQACGSEKTERPSLSFFGRAVLIRERLSRAVALVAATASKIAEASSQAGKLPTVYTWTSPRHDYL